MQDISTRRLFALAQADLTNLSTKVVAWLIVLACTAAQAQQKQEPPREKPKDAALAEMQQLADQIAVSSLKGDERVELPRHTKPLCRYHDRQRKLEDATVWAFGSKGRPEVLVTVEKYREFLSIELTSASAHKVAASVQEQWNWAPPKPGLELQPVPDAPAPAKDPEGRLAQMKDLAGRFDIRETTHNTATFIVPLLADPICRYADADSGILDGGMFAYAHGSNPEAILLLECHQAKGDKAQWSFAMIPATTLKLSATLGESQVWLRDFAQAPWQQETYTYGRADQVPRRDSGTKP